MNDEIRVIKILDQFTIIINVGYENSDISENDKVVIYEPGPEIKDLDGSILGNYDFKKAELIVTDVYPNFSVAKHLKKGAMFNINNAINSYTTSTPLRVKEDDITQFTPNSLEISIGDLVKLV